MTDRPTIPRPPRADDAEGPDAQWHDAGWTATDAAHYALCAGFGRDPFDQAALPFVQGADLRVLPAIATLAMHRCPTPALPAGLTGMLHMGQRIALHRPLRAEETLVARRRIAAQIDRGADRGLVMRIDMDLADRADGTPVASVSSLLLARDNGGAGQKQGEILVFPALPDRPPDRVVTIAVRPEQALFYRLLGDHNPLHSDPAAARAAGFDRPILHGLCTYAMLCGHLVRTHLDGDAAALRTLSARFRAPVYPGETLRLESWRDGDALSGRIVAVDRDVLVLDSVHAAINVPRGPPLSAAW